MSVRRYVPISVTLAMMAMSGALHAQSVGDRVRVTSVFDATITGEVTAVNEGGFELAEGGVLRSIEYGSVSLLERSTGTRSRWKNGLIYGAAVGAATGLLLMSSVSDLCFWGSCADVTVAEYLAGAGIVGGIGGVLGLGVGTLFKDDEWTPIPVPDSMVTIHPFIRSWTRADGRHGLVMGVRVRF